MKKKSVEETGLCLPFYGQRPHESGFRLRCPYCGSFDVTLLTFNRVTNNIGIRCWYCDCGIRLYDNKAMVRNFEPGQDLNTYHDIMHPENEKDYHELEREYKTEIDKAMQENSIWWIKHRCL